MVGLPAARSDFSTDTASRLTRLAPRISVKPLSLFMRLCSARYRGSASRTDWVAENPFNCSAAFRAVGAGAIASGRSTFPLVNIGVPATDEIAGKLTIFRFAVLSAIRPPHPAELWLFDTDVCHWFCWSECENKFSGTRAELFWYVVRDVGSTSGPTLQTTPSFPRFQSSCIPVMA